MNHQDSIPRAIEVGFPIVEINRLAVPERNSFKPIYQMHKWFARRASCVFRAILLGSLKPAKKRVSLTVLFCPKCEAVWQWRGDLPDGEMACPACGHSYDPHKGNVPEKGKFLCRCGNKDKIIESIRRLPKDRRLPVRPYALQAYLPPSNGEQEDEAQALMFGSQGWKPNTKNGRGPGPKTLLLPKNGKFFKGFSSSDQTWLQMAEALWEKHKDSLSYPKSEIPVGEKTKSGLLAHHYNYWHEMFFPRQLLALGTLLNGIMEEGDEKLKEMLLCSFSGALEQNNQFCRYMTERKRAGGQTGSNRTLSGWAFSTTSETSGTRSFPLIRSTS